MGGKKVKVLPVIPDVAPTRDTTILERDGSLSSSVCTQSVVLMGVAGVCGSLVGRTLDGRRWRASSRYRPSQSNVISAGDPVGLLFPYLIYTSLLGSVSILRPLGHFSPSPKPASLPAPTRTSNNNGPSPYRVCVRSQSAGTWPLGLVTVESSSVLGTSGDLFRFCVFCLSFVFVGHATRS